MTDSFNSSFVVFHEDESRAMDSPASSYIPTIGYPTTAVDQYRTPAVYSTNAPSLGGAFLDIEAAAALAKLGEGGLSSYRDLELAEQALQAVLLREMPKILVPGLKCGNAGSYYGYRFDADQRTEYCFDLLRPFGTTDYLFSSERVDLEDALVVASTNPKSVFVGRKVSEITFEQMSRSFSGKSVRMAASDLFGIPVYSSLKDFTDPRKTGAFAKLLYNQINLSWKDATNSVPPVSYDFFVPPLISVVMHRITGKREELGRVLMELRDELREAREELLRFEAEVTRTASQRDLNARVKRIEEAFSAIVPEAMLTSAQKRRRAILAMFNIGRPLLRIATAFTSINSANMDSVMNNSASLIDRLVERERITDRTVSSQIFSRVMDVEAVQQSLPSVISKAELRSIERSLQS